MIEEKPSVVAMSCASVVMKPMNSFTNSCMQCFAALLILAFGGKLLAMIRATLRFGIKRSCSLRSWSFRS